jgi:pyruvate/oxaloacetate carboxyltransferase
MGRDRGYDGGYGWYPAPVGPAYQMDAAEEMDMLKAEADYIKKSLETINKRIDELGKEPSEKS